MLLLSCLCSACVQREHLHIFPPFKLMVGQGRARVRGQPHHTSIMFLLVEYVADASLLRFMDAEGWTLVSLSAPVSANWLRFQQLESQAPHGCVCMRADSSNMA